MNEAPGRISGGDVPQTDIVEGGDARQMDIVERRIARAAAHTRGVADSLRQLLAGQPMYGPLTQLAAKRLNDQVLPYLDATARDLHTYAGQLRTAIAKQLNASAAPTVPQQRQPPRPSGEDPSVLSQPLLDHARQDRDWLRQTGERLRRNGDLNYAFVMTYYNVTDELIRKVEAGQFKYPNMALREEIAFTRIYRRNLEAWLAGKTVEPNWRVAFEEIKRLQNGDLVLTEGAERGMAVATAALSHIRFDLARSIASVYWDNYRAYGFETFRSDFFAMGSVFPIAQKRATEVLNQGASAFDPATWSWVQMVGKEFVLSVDAERHLAWDKAQSIVDSLRRGLNDPSQVEQRMRAYLRVRHPMRGGHAIDFSISHLFTDTEVNGYNWTGKP